MANIYQKIKGGTWYISYVHGGKLKHRSLGTKSFRVARRLKNEIELMLDSGPELDFAVVERPKIEAKNIGVKEFWTEFEKWGLEHRSRSTVEEYGVWFRRFIEFSAIETLAEATLDHAKGFKSSLQQQGKRKPDGVGLSKRSINSALRTLETIWNHANKLGYFAGPNPFEPVEAFKLPEYVPRSYLLKKEIDALLMASDLYARTPGVNPKEAQNVKVAIALNQAGESSFSTCPVGHLRARRDV